MREKVESAISKPCEILAPLWERKRKSNSRYSLRALARDLEMSPSYVSQVLNGKKIPSADVARKFKDLLGLTDLDLSLLLKSVAAHSPNAADSKELILDLLAKDRAAKGFAKHTHKNPNDLLKLTSWIHFAVLDLTTTENFNDDDRQTARRLGISISSLNSAIEDLVTFGLLKRENGRWTKTSKNIQFATDLSTQGTRQYHRQMISKALDVMEKNSEPTEVARRRITGATLAINPEHVPEAVRRINEFIYELTELLGQGPCKEVYQLNVQLVPLTSPNASHDNGEGEK
jgi:uncharacterized protein (TIGR02147 family)